jgi:hypothetical protein
LAHDPFVVVNTCPCCAVPETVGSEVFIGANGVTAPVAIDCAAADPPALVAVTTERILKPTSLACTTYELEPAPPISEHTPPVLSQSSHPYENDVGLPDQDPDVVVNV